MENRLVLIFCLLLLIGTVTGQSAPPRSSERLLPQWLTGIIAVSSFLLIIFIGFVVKKMWCEKSSGTKPNEETMGGNESVEGNLYDTDMNILQRTKSNESKRDAIYETFEHENEYETSTEALRSNSRKENLYMSCDDDNYETSLDVLRNQSRRNVYDNKAMDHTENKSTSM